MAQILVKFYVDDGLIASRDPVWLQESFDLLVGLFERRPKRRAEGDLLASNKGRKA